MTRREHIEQLAKELNATVEYTAARYEMQVNTLDRILYLAPWDEVPEEEVYWVGLHELGHLVLTDQSDPSHMVFREEDYFNMAFGLPHWGAEREARAWEWALDTSIFPLDQAGESSMAWGIADRLSNEYIIGDALRRIHRELGDDPDWFFNVTTEEHFAKLDGYARPRWAELTERLAREKVPS